MLIKINAIVREEKFEDVKEALNKIGVNGITVSQVMGCGAQKGFTEVVRGTRVDMLMRPKIKFEIVVSSEEWERKTIEAIQKAAFTGEVGDGKIFSYEVRNVVKIRTGERRNKTNQKCGATDNSQRPDKCYFSPDFIAKMTKDDAT